jgi:hypothetical protein
MDVAVNAQSALTTFLATAAIITGFLVKVAENR